MAEIIPFVPEEHGTGTWPGNSGKGNPTAPIRERYTAYNAR